MDAQNVKIFEFDGFRLDTDKQTLWYNDEIVPLQPRTVKLLAVFVSRNGDLLSKDSLLEQVWGETFVEESNLSHNIYLLRKALGSNGKEYIQTVPRRGYCFSANVTGIVEHQEITIERSYFSETIIEETINDTSDQSSVIVVHPEVPSTHLNRLNKRSIGICAGIASLVVIAVAVWLSWASPQKNSRFNEIRSLAVIPFDHQGGSDETIPIRLTDSLITGLRMNDEISVRPVSSMLAYIRGDRNPIDIGRDLLVDAVIDGRLQQEGDKLRLNVQLILIKTNETIWSGQFDGNAEDLLSLQDKVVNTFITDNGLTDVMFAKNKTRANPTSNSRAYEEYLKGRYFFARRNGHDLLTAEKHFRNSIELDQNFAEPKVGLANILAFRQFERKEAEELAREAMRLAPDLAEPHATIAFIMSYHDWNWKAAEAEFLQAIYLDPRDSLIRQWYANNLMIQGRYVEAEAQFIRSLELDPTSAAITTDLAELYFYQRRYDRALEKAKAALALQRDAVNADSFVNKIIGLQYREERKQDPTIEVPKEVKKILAAIEISRLPLDRLDRSSLTYGSELMRHLNYNLWHENSEEVFQILDLMADMNHFMLPIITHDPYMDMVRDDPRFQLIRKKVNLGS
ncbi:MAG: winged helix-turn-helix domain-containing protein [Acidobacteria bacterium]|nr:winged helix-turn-helix domain-containing protein [Acidobacteriota bacterium]